MRMSDLIGRCLYWTNFVFIFINKNEWIWFQMDKSILVWVFVCLLIEYQYRSPLIQFVFFKHVSSSFETFTTQWTFRFSWSTFDFAEWRRNFKRIDRYIYLIEWRIKKTFSIGIDRLFLIIFRSSNSICSSLNRDLIERDVVELVQEAIDIGIQLFLYQHAWSITNSLKVLWIIRQIRCHLIFIKFVLNIHQNNGPTVVL